MSVVMINALDVPEGAGAQLEARFAARKHIVDNAAGFEGFELLRPVAGESRYFVVTRWASQADYETWRDGDARKSSPRQGPDVATGHAILEFEVVDFDHVAQDD